MAVISGNEKQKLIDLFIKRGVKFYHACQWVDFKTYCELGGVPSRGLMESTQKTFTVFDTDGRDKDNGVWNFVFGNLIDSGTHFARMGQDDTFIATPNVFGPILLVFEPSALNFVDDIAITLRSAGGKDFDREQESLSTVEEINRIFQFENIDEAGYEQAKAYIKFSSELNDEFGISDAGNPEVSCSIQEEVLPFKLISKIVVDKITVGENYLPYHVYEKINEFEINCSVSLRKYKFGREELFSELIKASLESIDVTTNELSDDFNEWIKRILTKDKSLFFFKRFVKYWENGTINELVKETKLEYGILNLPPSFNE
jgi:hypothetical protein